MIAQLSCVMLCTTVVHLHNAYHAWPSCPHAPSRAYLMLRATLDSAHQCALPSSRLPHGPRLSPSGTLVHRLSGRAYLAPSLGPFFFLRQLNSFLHVYLTDNGVPFVRPIPHR
jgi:hypothetical protein